MIGVPIASSLFLGPPYLVEIGISGADDQKDRINHAARRAAHHCTPKSGANLKVRCRTLAKST